MAVEDLPDVVIALGKIGLWIQAVGLVVVLWIIFQSITMYFNRKRRLALHELINQVKKLEMKVDKLIKEKSKQK